MISPRKAEGSLPSEGAPFSMREGVGGDCKAVGKMFARMVKLRRLSRSPRNELDQKVVLLMRWNDELCHTEMGKKLI